MGYRGGGVKLTLPPSISWFSSTPAEIGLKANGKTKQKINYLKLFERTGTNDRFFYGTNDFWNKILKK